MPDELAGSPEESFEGGVFTARQTVRCPWGDRLLLAQQLQGYAISDGTNINVYQAQLYPYTVPVSTQPRVTSVRIKPWFDQESQLGDGPNLLKYNWAELEINYGAAAIAVAGAHNDDPQGAEVEEGVRYWAEFLTLPGEKLYWGSTEQLTDSETPGKLERGLTWTYKKKNMAFVPTETLELIGKVNDVAVTSVTLGLTFEAETLLFQPPTQQRTSAGWDLEYGFNYRPHGWNNFYNVGDGSYQPVFSAPDGFSRRDIYETGDFFKIVR